MARKNQDSAKTGRTILLVDDNLDYLEATRLVLSREGHDVLTAASGPEALEILKDQAVELVLLDYHMPGMTGEEVVENLRQFNKHVQVILQTGYASESPPREMLRKLDIQGYFDKSEGTEKLLLWTEAGLKSAYTLQLLLKSRQGLQYILEVTPELHKIQPLEDLLQGILWQVSGLLGCTNSFLALMSPPDAKTIVVDSFLAMVDQEMHLQIHAGVGRFHKADKLESLLTGHQLDNLNRIFLKGEPSKQITETVFPLTMGENTIGLLYLDKGGLSPEDLELLTIFSNQAAVSIQNSQLYSMATQDPLSGVYVRKFYDHWILKELRTAFRANQCLSLIMFDLDNMKNINDTWGHPAGDLAISRTGRILQKATRSTDFIARFGGDEFALILPATDGIGAQTVAEKIIKLLHGEVLTVSGARIELKASMGSTTLPAQDRNPDVAPSPLSVDFFNRMAALLLKKADESLYAAKKAGRDCFVRGSDFSADELA